MSFPSVAGAVLLVGVGAAHSYLGERYILVRLFRRTDLPPLFGSDVFTKRTLRFAWHLTSVAWWGFAAVLLAAAQASPAAVALAVAMTFLATGLVTLAASRGRHLAWPVFLAIALLAWLTACHSPRASPGGGRRLVATCIGPAGAPITAAGVGVLRLGMSFDSVRLACRGARDTADPVPGRKTLAIAVPNGIVVARSDDPIPGRVLALDIVTIAAPGFRTAAGIGVGSPAHALIAAYGTPRYYWCSGTASTPGVVDFASAPTLSFELVTCSVNATGDHASGLDTLRVQRINVFVPHP